MTTDNTDPEACELPHGLGKKTDTEPKTIVEKSTVVPAAEIIQQQLLAPEDLTPHKSEDFPRSM